MSTQQQLSSGGSGTSDVLTQSKIYKYYVSVLIDPNSKEELKLKAVMELSDNFENIVAAPYFPNFLEHSIKLFSRVLLEGPPVFIVEYNMQQIRKQILEMMYLLPCNDHVKIYVRQILTVVFKLLEIENEENVLVCLRLIMELHKQFRPAFNAEIHNFVQLVKKIYAELPLNKDKIFEPKPTVTVKDIQEIDINAMLLETYTVTTIQTENKSTDGNSIAYNLIPKGLMSLKVLQELPVVLVLMYQLYKTDIHDELAEFVPSIINIITLRSTPEQTSNPQFNKEVFVDFMGAQVKTLSFVAYCIKLYPKEVNQHSQALARGIISMLQACPMEVVGLRKELFVAARHITATELRVRFAPYMELLFDEDVLLGRGWTSRETLRPLAYSTLADLVHHLRSNLPINVIERAIHFFSKNAHDESLPTQIQCMSCKLLLNLVECVRSRSDGESGRALLMRLLQVFVLKFKHVAKYQLPVLIAKNKATQAEIKGEDQKSPPSEITAAVAANATEKSKFGFPVSPSQNYNLHETRNLVKTLICGVKTITWGITNLANSGDENSNKKFQPEETLLFIKLVKWAMQALDIYTLSATPAGAPAPNRNSSPQSVRTKEEKEMLEYFAGVFSSMATQTFHEIFSTTIDYLVERIYCNYALQIVGNSFLANPSMSSVFATILVEYLLERMEEMGSNLDKSNLYLKLFKLVFGSVSLFPSENEQMLRPHLHQIVNRSMELAMSAKEPYNYFLLLRALFRSIGGGCHDLLYQEFLPLLPTLLQGLNCLQSGLHKQHMKDLFVELCLTVPVRLSSLLPYLPMLMDPLVSALNGSPTLISQGLRTLELCVDNLQPDFLYEHIQPVRADLMQALWRTLRNPQDQVAHVAFRVLGKFGGGNRKMMIEPQRLEYNDIATEPSSLVVYFDEYPDPVHLPVQKIIETALTTLKKSTSDPFYRRQAWEVVRDFLIASIQLDESKKNLANLLTHPSFHDGPIANHSVIYKMPRSHLRDTHQTALTALFVTAAVKELYKTVLPSMVAVVRHYTMIAVCQQAGPFAETSYFGMDPLVIVDALVTIMGHEEKELSNPGIFAICRILETATVLMGSKERACQLPLMEYLSEKMVALCYERAWYAKYGGCIVINLLFQQMTKRWVFDHLYVFLKASLFVMMDLTGEVSTGAIDMAKSNLLKLLTECSAPITPDENNADLIEAQKKSMHDVVLELVRSVASPNTLVREQAMSSLTLIAEIQGVTVTQVMEPHRKILSEMVPFKKNLLRHQTVNAQIGIMEGNTFCTTLNPRLFTIDLTIVEHKAFLHEVLSLVVTDDKELLKYPCYKQVTNLAPLRQCALRALSACHYIPSMREKIFNALYQAMEKPELQKVVLDCMKNFIAGAPVDGELVRSVMRPLLLSLADHRSMDVITTKRFYYLAELFPATFNEKFCEQMYHLLKKILEVQPSNKTMSRNGDNEQNIITIINIFPKTPAAGPRFCDLITRAILQAEKNLWIEASSPFREPLVQFLLRYPTETIRDMFLNDSIKDRQWSRFLIYLLKHKEGKPFRDVVQNNVPKLISLVTAVANKVTLPMNERVEIQFQAIHTVAILIRYDEQWLSTQKELTQALKELWCSEEFQERHRNIENIDNIHWSEPKYVVRILLHYFCHHPNEVELLFHLLRATYESYMPDFQFLRDFLENTVAQNYTVEWKRSAFFRFVQDLRNPTMSEELKAKILQLVLIPCFSVGFERGERERLIGSPVSPDQDDPENIVSVFITQVIDPDNPFGNTDAVRIALLQFSCLLVEQASPHIHNATKKKQGQKLRRLMAFAWPCLLVKNCVDPSTRYHGHLLLSHIIAKFAIHKRIALQVFHSLLKAHGVEARSVVRQALEILTPAMPHRMEDGNIMLTHWTKKIIVEDGHNLAQLFHILFLVVKHSKVYYPVRHHLIQHMIQSMQKMGFSASSHDHRKLAVELAEVIIKWELQRIRDDVDSQKTVVTGELTKRPSTDDGETLRKRLAAGTGSVPSPVQVKTESTSNTTSTSSNPIEKHHADAVLNYLMRLACQVNDATPTTNGQGDLLSRKCMTLLKTVMKPELWPQPWDLKLNWLDRILVTIDSQNPPPNQGNISTGIELLTFLLGVLKREQILAILRHLQKGLTCCVNSTNSKFIRLTQAFLMKLSAMFPMEVHGSGNVAKVEELETLYTNTYKYILESLSNYEKGQAAVTGSIYGSVMILKAACTSNPAYVDRLLPPLMRALQRMHKEHGQTQVPAEQAALGTDMLIAALDMVKNRMGALQTDMRKIYIGTILVKLIETTRESKLMKAITKMLEEWIKQVPNQRDIAHYPVLKEKCLLLVRLMTYIERNFPDDLELNTQFLEIVNFVYRDPHLKASELAQKLEPAFLQGLRCTQPALRAKFFEIFDSSMKRRIYDRLYYLICSQNWETIGPHYWIKQCIELLFITAEPSKGISLATVDAQLPSMATIIESASSEKRAVFEQFTSLGIKREAPEVGESPETHENDELDIEFNNANSEVKKDEPAASTKQEGVAQLIARQSKFMDSVREVKTTHFLRAAAQLCHMDTALAERVWLDLFPRIWLILTDRQRTTLTMDMMPFICSGAHEIQKNCQPSAVNTFVEALSRCNPPVAIRPVVMKYLGKTHNLWHRMTLNLEQLLYEQESARSRLGEKLDLNESELMFTSNSHEVLDSLSEMYSKLCEQDMWSGLWQRHARYRETNIAIAYELQGFFESAQGTYEAVMSKSRAEFSSTAAPVMLRSEYKLWEEHWIRCSKELNQWDTLLEYGHSRGSSLPMLVLESSWKIPNWNLMKEALAQIENTVPKELMWKIELYRGFLHICNSDDVSHGNVEKCVERASASAMKEWRRLPHIVSHIHLPLLQAAQQIMELQEAAQIHQSLTPSRSTGTSLHDMKAIVKTWRNRLPVIADDLSHWSDIFTWRQHHYQFIASHYDNQHETANNPQNMLGLHASAQAIIHFGKIARKHNLISVCLESLSRIYTIPSVPIVDCFQKIRQQVKCSLQLAHANGRHELQEGLEVIESTNVRYFTKEMTAEFCALKGMLLSQIGQTDEAYKAFSAAVQMHDTLVKAWALWGDYLEQAFITDASNISYGVQAITCFLHACRHQNESKSRKYLAKVLWLLNYDNEQWELGQALEKYCIGVPPIQWLPWVPQLLTCLVSEDGKYVLNLISQVARIYPQAVFFPLRTLFITLKIERIERHKTAELSSVQQDGELRTGETNPIRATPPMWRCSRIMQMQHEVHPTILSSLEGIADHMACFCDNWYEDVLRQLKQGLAKCYAIAFEKRGNVAEATITPHTLNFVNKLVATFGVGMEKVNSAETPGSCSPASVSLARRKQSAIEDPDFLPMKNQFACDMDFVMPGARKLQNVIEKLRNWIVILQTKARAQPKTILIEDKSKFLSNFSRHTAEVELPGEFLLPKHAHYYVKISRFMPRVDIVHKHNTTARRLHIRGHNGKVYPYLIVNDSYIGDARREERVLQLLRMLNHFLGKQKETSSRFLHMTVPRVVAVSPQLRLVEDNPASMSLHDIYREMCEENNIDHDDPITRYYERLQEAQATKTQPSYSILKEIFKDVQKRIVPKTMLKEWALRTFPSTTDFWTFRKMVMLQLSLACFVEYSFHLSRLNPDMMYLHKDSGLVNISYFKFDIDCQPVEAERPVRIRLTPNLTELISMIGVRGPLIANGIACARCFSRPNFNVKPILRAILRDEMIYKHKGHKERENAGGPAEQEGKLLIESVNNAANDIMQRMSTLGQFEGPESKMGSLVASSCHEDNLCRMDPAWHPWL